MVRRAQRDADVPAPIIDPDQWYSVEEVSDGSQFTIEVLPGFEYGVEFLGVNVPRIYVGQDSSDYYANEAAEYLRNLISGGEVRLQGASGDRPDTGYGAFQAYVMLRKGKEQMIALNKHLLQQGFGQYEHYYAQHPDSVLAYKQYAEKAKQRKVGMWQHSQKVGEKVSREEAGGVAEPSEAFPININTADAALLRLLPGIGPVYAKRIIAYRERNGLFSDVEQLKNIRGIGPKTMEKLRPNVVVDRE